FAMIQVEMQDKEAEKKVDNNVKVIGIDRGIKNIAVLSNNRFFNSKTLRSVKGRYRYNRKKLQHAGTRSAHRKLKDLSGRERRFVQDTNHVLSRQIVSLPFDVIALEDLDSAGMRKKRNRRRFNTMLGSWSPFQLRQFIEYKALERDKSVVHIDPGYTSQKCSQCGFIDSNNRKGSTFHCLNCGFDLHADLKAARNIEILGKSEYFRLLSTS
ncbi:MAG: RNA-guided endonuclease InsQ/TnpB family protein, partial [Thermoplasmata archaeon]